MHSWLLLDYTNYLSPSNMINFKTNFFKNNIIILPAIVRDKIFLKNIFKRILNNIIFYAHIMPCIMLYYAHILLCCVRMRPTWPHIRIHQLFLKFFNLEGSKNKFLLSYRTKQQFKFLNFC